MASRCRIYFTKKPFPLIHGEKGIFSFFLFTLYLYFIIIFLPLFI